MHGLFWLGRKLGYWDKDEQRRVSCLIEKAESGYCKISPKEFRTRSINDLKKVALSDRSEEWGAFNTQMNAFFEDKIRIFPFSDSIETANCDSTTSRASKSTSSKSKSGRTASNPSRHWLYPLLGIEKPLRFDLLQAEMIERRFPGGRNRDIGDGDFRDLITGLRVSFASNFTRLVVRRRRWQLYLSALVVIAAALAATFGGQIPYATPAAYSVFVTAPFVLLFIFGHQTNRYNSALEESCANVRTGAQMRQQELVALLPLIFAEVDRQKFELKTQRRLEQWPIETKKWSKIAFWIDGRVENNELFTQLEMWRTRRINFFVRLAGLFVAVIIAIAFGVGLAVAAPMAGIDLMLTLAGVLSIASILFLTVKFALPSFDLIERTLKTENMKGSSDTKLDEQVADFMYREKSSHLHEEEKLSGKS
jgi:hypothetical protein